MKRTQYFAYGSNLDPAQMRRRCPHAAPGRPAILRGHRIAFGGHSRTWGGPVATLVKDPNDWVDGLLYEMPLAELTVLDGYEGHPFAYRRKLLLITDDTGRRRRANVYVLPVVEETRPTPRYFGVIWRAYLRLGFDRTPLAAAAGGVR